MTAWTIRLLSCLVMSMACVVLPPVSHGGTVLFDNLNAGSPNGFSGVSNDQWNAQAFSTTSTAFVVSDVTLSMFNLNGTTGSYELQIWTATGESAAPGSQVGSAMYTGLAENLGAGPLTASGLNVALAPSTTYYLVARGVSLTDVPRPGQPGEFLPGMLAWNATDVNTMPTFATTDGVDWAGPYSQNLFMKVEAAPIPEIDPAGFGSVAALVSGALGLIERRRLKARAA